MLTVTFAFVVATALFLMFAQTRWMGVVGVFVLLCINPPVFGTLLVLAGLVHYLRVKSRTYEFIPKRRLLTDDEMKRRRRNIALLLAALGVGVTLALGYSTPTVKNVSARILDAVRAAPREEVIVLRTSGGLLEVSRIQSTEVFDATIKHEILGVPIGETAPRIRVPAVFDYHVALQPEWRVVRADGVFTVVAPNVQPSLPVAIDTSGLQKVVAGSWFLVPFTSTKDLDTLERSITAKLEQKARSRDYIDRQREDARATIAEFVRNWLLRQARWKQMDYADIRVRFADDPPG